MRIDIYDDDLIGKDLIGYCNVDLSEVLNKPCIWAINKTF